MLLNAELLLQYQRCKRRPYLDAHGEKSQRDAPSELLLKLQQERVTHQQTVLEQLNYHQPQYSPRNWRAGAKATLELMQQGVDCISQGVLLATYRESYTLLSCPDLLIKQPGNSRFGEWSYFPATIELGKRPKQEYQVVAAFHAQVLAAVQEVAPDRAWLLLRGTGMYRPPHAVDLAKWIPQMHSILNDCIATLEAPEAPEVFISRQRCNLCRWYSQCYNVAQSQCHLSLLPGVTPTRYTQLQALNLTTVESLANTSPSELENLPGFDEQVAPKLVIQAQAVVEKRPLILDYPGNYLGYKSRLLSQNHHISTYSYSPIELYFDIEAQPNLNLDYLLGVLVVDKQNNQEKFYSFLAEKPEEEALIWQQFLDLVWEYPQAPIFHFCSYEVDTIKRLAKLYRTKHYHIEPLLTRCVDIYEQVTQTVALPVESYALKAIARWLGFEWRDPEASGAKCIYWYDEWLETGDRTLLEIIQRYNEDDCHATRRIKDWMVSFMLSPES
ncbi:MAG: TM0106 family RecB-like putative nuclease [Nostocaceae cyanobacterium]|nr:TM0106 family RecB-like putative nuclease [Nostocaceae cyanobacterium]